MVIQEETKRTEEKEEAGYRSPKWSILRALQKINKAKRRIIFPYVDTSPISRWPSRLIWDEIPTTILQSWFDPIPSLYLAILKSRESLLSWTARVRFHSWAVPKTNMLNTTKVFHLLRGQFHVLLHNSGHEEFHPARARSGD